MKSNSINYLENQLNSNISHLEKNHFRFLETSLESTVKLLKSVESKSLYQRAADYISLVILGNPSSNTRKVSKTIDTKLKNLELTRKELQDIYLATNIYLNQIKQTNSSTKNSIPFYEKKLAPFKPIIGLLDYRICELYHLKADLQENGRLY